MTRRCLTALLLAATSLVSACGGGTSGSGVNSYEGKIASTEGQPLAEVNVTIESTGDSTITDQNGQFALSSDAHGLEVPFLLESSRFRNRFVLRDIPADSSRVTVHVTVDTQTDQVDVRNISVRAGMVGLCDKYFENRETIRQANRVPLGTHCSLNVEVLGDGHRLSNFPVELQYSTCAPGARWSTLVKTHTGSGAHAGSAEINFEFRNSREFCRYRVAIPVNAGSAQFATYPIDTFSEQENSTPLQSHSGR